MLCKTHKQIALKMGVTEDALYKLKARVEKDGFGTKAQRSYLKAIGKRLVVIDDK